MKFNKKHHGNETSKNAVMARNTSYNYIIPVIIRYNGITLIAMDITVGIKPTKNDLW